MDSGPFVITLSQGPDRSLLQACYNYRDIYEIITLWLAIIQTGQEYIILSIFPD
jgi:hypothetical protein